jgi:L-threonylcarbamoyladenylate synthase
MLNVRGEAPDPPVLAEVARFLHGGGVIAMPTETVYGFGCALLEGPIQRIQAMKGRSPDRPFLVLVPSRQTVTELAWTPEAEELARVFWPGALTLVLRDTRRAFPPGVRSPRGSVAVRVSPHPVARGLLENLGGPITSTSANPSGDPPALTALEAREAAVAADAGGEVWVLDGGPLEPSLASTIVDFSGPEPFVSRIGAIPPERLRCVLPDIHVQN